MSCREVTGCCNSKTLQVGEKFIGTDFDVCLPFGARLYSVEGVIQYMPPAIVPVDGVYTSVEVKNGCIVSVGSTPLPTYNTTPCAPVPVPCNCGGGSGTSTLSISTDAGNLSRLDSSGRLMTTVSFSAGAGVAITGLGTQASPFRISVSGEVGSGTVGETVLMPANEGITISGTGGADSPYMVGHAQTLDTTTQFEGMTFDRFGHLIATNEYTTANRSLLHGVINGDGIEVSTDVNTGIATVSLAKPVYPFKDGTLTIGGYTVELDEYNRIYRVQGSSNTGSVSTDAGTNNGMTFCHRFGSSPSTVNSVTLRTAVSGGLKIELDTYRAPESLSLDVDGEGITFWPIVEGHRYVALTGTKSAGTHTITVHGSLDNPSFLSITVCERV